METMVFWHGGDLSDINNTFKQQTKKQEYGPGLYLTTSYEVVKKYIKGSRKLYRVEVALGNSLERKDIPYDNVLEFLYKLPRSISIKLKDKFDEYNKNGFVSAEIINNVFVNNNLLKPEISYKLKEFYLKNNIDYSLVVNAFGWGEDMMILFNTNKIINVKRIGPKDKIDKYELHKEGMEITKKDLINQAHKDITRTKGKDYAPDVHEIQKWINNPKKLKDDAEEITKGELEEAKKARTKLRKKKKADRCTRIAKSKYDVWPSAYSSAAVVRCRQGKIWTDLKEEDENFGSDDINLSGHKNYNDWVFIHRNLNRPTYWSIKQSNGNNEVGLVIGYDTSILLKDVKFIVKKSGQKTVREKKQKNVHAGTVGKIVDSGGNYDTNGWTLVTYNPYTDNTFIEKETGEPIYTAKEAVLKNTKEIWVKKEDDSLNEKTDYSKEKEQGLHGWFARQGGKGKSKGWVDCNTCRDGKCKSCGRKEGESRAKYPACRPTPSACKTKGKGDSWGKKSKN